MARRQPDLRKLAARQRWVLWLVAAWLVFRLLPFLVVPALPASPVVSLAMLALGLTQFALWVAIIVVGILVMCADGTHPALIVLAAIFMLAPCANLLILLFLVGDSARKLKKAGVRVGFMGANQEDVERALNFSLCRGCGYDLTGNTSGVCPECGRPVETRFCTACGYNLTGNTSGVCPECGQTVGHVVSAPPVA